MFCQEGKIKEKQIFSKKTTFADCKSKRTSFFKAACIKYDKRIMSVKYDKRIMSVKYDKLKYHQ